MPLRGTERYFSAQPMSHVACMVVILVVEVLLSALYRCLGDLVADRIVFVGYVIEEVVEITFLVSIVDAERMYVGYSRQGLHLE